MNKFGMTDGRYSDNDWLDKVSRRSPRTRVGAKTALKTFDFFCEDQDCTRDDLIKQYQIWYNPKPKPDELVRPNIQNICLSLDKYVDFLGKEHEFSDGRICRKKSDKTVKIYFLFVKSYLKICHKIRLSNEDIKDYVTFPKQRKEPRIPLSLKQLKQIMNNASPKRKALYYILVSSGMRLGEALSLTKKNIHLDENPVRITLLADNTKTKQGRESYISSEAVEKLTPLLEGVDDDEKFFLTSDNLHYDVINEDRVFGYLRDKLGFTEKYPDSVRYVVNIHSMRAYFHTKASQKHGVEYANALDGHSGYLDQYYRLDPKKRAEMYKELENDLLIESVKIHADKNKDKMITTLQEQMAKLQEEMFRLQKYPQNNPQIEIPA